MRLQTRFNRITIISTFLALLIAGIGYYFLIHYVLIKQLDAALKVEEVEIHDYIRKHNSLPEATVYKDQRIEFERTDQPVVRVFKSIHTLHPEEKEEEPGRCLEFAVTAGGLHYMARVTKSEEATEDLVWVIVIATFALMLLLTVTLFLTNRIMFKKLWQPFRATLSSIKSFDLSRPSDIKSEYTSITEFRELNDSIRLMSRQVINDYESLKSFTDHASHEMQTPLAVITSKLDNLIQQPDISEASMQEIQGVYNSVEKLSRMTQSLLLMTKIGNNQFTVTEIISLKAVVKEKLREMEEITGVKSARFELLVDDILVPMNKELAEIMVSNLVRNAFRHSAGWDNVIITLSPDKLIISNAGETALDSRYVFTPFFKSDQSPGNGLGLAIVRSICDLYHFRITYSFQEGRHVFSMQFPQKPFMSPLE